MEFIELEFGECRVWGVEYRVKCCRVKGGCGFRCGWNMWVEYVILICGFNIIANVVESLK